MILAVLGTAAAFISVKIPHTEAFIDGRWAMGFIGFVLLRKRLALLLMLLLSIPYLSDVPFFTGFFGNLLYAIPAFICIRVIHTRYLSRLQNGQYALGWVVLILACYQLFTTPAVWTVLAIIQDIPIWSNVMDGWRTQPYLIESLLVAIVSASIMFAFRSYTQVKKSRKELEITLNSIGDAVISTDIDGMITKMNPAAQNLTGWSLEKAYAKPLTEVFHVLHGESKEPFEEPIQKILSDPDFKGPYLDKFSILTTRYGSERRITANMTPMRHESGEISGLVLVFRDVTAEYEADLAIRESEEKYRLLFNNASDAIFIAQDDVIKFPNPKTIEMTGYALERLHQMPFSAIIHPKDRDMLMKKHRPGAAVKKHQPGAAAKKHPTSYSLRIYNEAGEQLWVQMNTVAIKWDGRPATLNFARDITDSKKLESRIQQAQRLESIGNLANGIAHDFNNVLYPIVGMSEMMMEDMPEDSLEYEKAKEIFKAAIRGADLVKQILAFSRQSEVRKIPVRFKKILEEVLKLSRATIPSNITITPAIQDDCGMVNADPTQLHQVAMNLITNAYHAVEPKEDGQISVELIETALRAEDAAPLSIAPGEYAKLTVADNGTGISKALIEKIFEPYFTTKAKGKGTGIGLAVVHGIVNESGGAIKVYSEPGEGTTFIIYLPLIQKTEEEEHLKRSLEYETGSEKILFVDDEIEIARIQKMILERLGYQVTIRSSSVEALETFRKNPQGFDLLITDMYMPNMTGVQLARELHAIRADIPVVLCTGFSEKINQETAQAMGISGYLMKPAVMADMARMIRKVLDGKNGRASPHFS